MEFEDLNEEVEWEARRVAAAFEIGEWKSRQTIRVFRWRCASYSLTLNLSNEGELQAIEITGVDEDNWCSVWYSEKWDVEVANQRNFNDLMARGLYRLGFEDESVLAQLPSLTAHEKLELRLSTPREFWLQKWLDAE